MTPSNVSHLLSRLALCAVILAHSVAFAQDIPVQETEGIVEDPQEEIVHELPEKKPAKEKSERKTVTEEEGTLPAEDAPPPPESTYTNAITLQLLNKVTARIQKLEGPIGAVMRFGNLEIIPRRCWKSSPEDRPESAALLEVWEIKPGEGPQQVFLGWMFASSPGLSSLEHPVYDLSVLTCENRDDSAQ